MNNNSKLSSKTGNISPSDFNKLMNEILVVTMAIKNKFPEHYVHLDEMPSSFSLDNKGLCKYDFEQYLNTLKLQLNKCDT